jgi:hypothetical protein
VRDNGGNLSVSVENKLVGDIAEQQDYNVTDTYDYRVQQRVSERRYEDALLALYYEALGSAIEGRRRKKMATESAGRPVSKGVCTFCKVEIAKNKATQHLKFCKQRLAAIASQEEKSRKTKTRLFHILAEGQYSPQYWLHFEIPASETLWSLDHFLKDMWIDDLDHLSGFTINGTNYSTDYPDEYFAFAEEEEEVEEEEVSEEEIEAEVRELIDETIANYGEIAKSSALLTINPFPAEWVAEIRKPRPLDELVDFLKEERARLRTEEKNMWKPDNLEASAKELHEKHFTVSYQKMVVESLLDATEDRSMDVSLGRVLKVGQKFSYIYDYGSSTYVNLRVIAEREGIVENKKKPVHLLAQNTAPTFPCSVCGKPGTKVAMGYFYGGDIGDSVYCDACAEERDDGEFNALPIINSPRVGVL